MLFRSRFSFGSHGELLGERALEGRDDLVVQRARIDVRFFNHTHDSLKLCNRVHALEGADEQQAPLAAKVYVEQTLALAD